MRVQAAVPPVSGHEQRLQPSPAGQVVPAGQVPPRGSMQKSAPESVGEGLSLATSFGGLGTSLGEITSLGDGTSIGDAVSEDASDPLGTSD